MKSYVNIFTCLFSKQGTFNGKLLMANVCLCMHVCVSPQYPEFKKKVPKPNIIIRMLLALAFRMKYISF